MQLYLHSPFSLHVVAWQQRFTWKMIGNYCSEWPVNVLEQTHILTENSWGFTLCLRFCNYTYKGKRNVERTLTMDFPGGSDDKESACNAGDPCSIPGWGRSPGERNGYPLQYSWLENSMDRGAWQATFHGVTKSLTWMNNSHFDFNFVLHMKS